MRVGWPNPSSSAVRKITEYKLPARPRAALTQSAMPHCKPLHIHATIHPSIPDTHTHTKKRKRESWWRQFRFLPSDAQRAIIHHKPHKRNLPTNLPPHTTHALSASPQRVHTALTHSSTAPCTLTHGNCVGLWEIKSVFN